MVTTKLPDFREVNFGSMELKHRDEFDIHNIPPDVETRKSVMARAKKVLDLIYAKHKNHTVVLVGHGGVNRSMLRVIFQESGANTDELPRMHNTSITIFEIEEDRNHKIHLLNCVEHLGGEKKY